MATQPSLWPLHTEHAYVPASMRTVHSLHAKLPPVLACVLHGMKEVLFSQAAMAGILSTSRRSISSRDSRSVLDFAFAEQGAAEAKEGSDAKEGVEIIKARTETDKSEAISEASTSKVSIVDKHKCLTSALFCQINKLQVD